ncbi:hypothetical protein ABPG72_012554 [Tetrahymena utriculariae]
MFDNSSYNCGYDEEDYSTNYRRDLINNSNDSNEYQQPTLSSLCQNQNYGMLQQQQYQHSQPNLNQDEPPSQGQIPLIHNIQRSKKNSHWSNQENELYELFLQTNYDIAFSEDKNIRKQQKFFVKMSQFIVTRDDKQCKSHHQKCLKKGIINDIKKRIQRDQAQDAQLFIQEQQQLQGQQQQTQHQQKQQQYQQQNCQRSDRNQTPFYLIRPIYFNENLFNQETFAEFLLQSNQQAQKVNFKNGKFQQNIFLLDSQQKQHINTISNVLQNYEQHIFHFFKSFKNIIKNEQLTFGEDCYLEQAQFFQNCDLEDSLCNSSHAHYMQAFQNTQQIGQQNLDDIIIAPFQYSGCAEMLSDETTLSISQKKKSAPIKKRISKKKC